MAQLMSALIGAVLCLTPVALVLVMRAQRIQCDRHLSRMHRAGWLAAWEKQHRWLLRLRLAGKIGVVVAFGGFVLIAPFNSILAQICMGLLLVLLPVLYGLEWCYIWRVRRVQLPPWI